MAYKDKKGYRDGGVVETGGIQNVPTPQTARGRRLGAKKARGMGAARRGGRFTC